MVTDRPKRDIIERPPESEDTDEMQVVIVRNSDGERRIDVPSWKPCYTWSDEYWWTEGNMGCDCNRALCWARIDGDPDVVYVECGRSIYRVILRAPGATS